MSFQPQRKIKGKFKPMNDKEVAQEVAKMREPEATSLLDLVGEIESNNNYNAYYNNSQNDSVKFTDMSINEVLDWQNDYVGQGSVSSAVGKYQIIRKTLKSLVKEMGLTGSEKFDELQQDRMAKTLLNRRGFNKFKTGKLSLEGFANNLAKEWAALPVFGGDNHGLSYYAKDNINKARISNERVEKTLAGFRKNIV